MEKILLRNIDVPDFHLRAFVDAKDDFEGRRRNLPDVGRYGRELAAALREVLLQDVRGTLYLRGIVLRFDTKADLTFFEAVQDFGLRDGLRALILDGPNYTALRQDVPNDPTFICEFLLESNVVEPARVP